MNMKFDECDINGCYLITPRIIEDDRGLFVKIFHKEMYDQQYLESDFKEEYYSTSKKNVIRGMHFQTPPSDHAKLVYCISGVVEDVFIDLRKKSTTYLKHQKVNLDDNKKQVLYLPKGVAHGFLTLSESATMVYKTTTVYNPEKDSGIHWDSCGIDWSIEEPIISKRDGGFCSLENFNTPFVNK